MTRIHLGVCAAVAVAAAALIGCGKSDSTPQASSGKPTSAPKLSPAMLQPGQELDYFPMAMGNQWTYDSEMIRVVNGVQQAPQRNTITYRVKKATKLPDGGVEARFDILEGEKVIDRETWRIDKQGITQVAVGMNLNRFNPAQPVLRFPVKKGASLKWSGTVTDDKGVTRRSNMTTKVDGEEQIDTPFRAFNALTVVSSGSMTAPNLKTEMANRMWLAPGVGMVRVRQELFGEVTSTDPKLKGRKAQVGLIRLLKLKNFTPKK